MPVARQEDEWDEILIKQFGLGVMEDGHSHKDPKWIVALQGAHWASINAYEQELATDRELAKKMLAIVDEETRLAKLEGQEVIRGRKGKPIRPRWLT